MRGAIVRFWHLADVLVALGNVRFWHCKLRQNMPRSILVSFQTPATDARRGAADHGGYRQAAMAKFLHRAIVKSRCFGALTNQL
jgi:hypothetical protein